MNTAVVKDLQEIARDLPELLWNSFGIWLERFLERHPDGVEWLADNRQTRLRLVRLVACSEFAANVIMRDWQWFTTAELDARPVHPADPAMRMVTGEECDTASAMRRFREFRNRGMLHLLWREMTGAATLAETLQALSELADSLVSAAIRYAEAEFASRFGTPRDEDGGELRIVVLAMGKLGGQELNFSSDIDLIFLYPGDGQTDGKRTLSAQEYFTRLARRIVALLDEVTAEGFVYRVDTRLRPFGDSGPPVVSFSALESYLSRHGRGWERYAYVKARVIDTHADSHVASELMQQIVEPFVYRRYLDYGVFESLREMKALIVAETRKRNLQQNIKLGPGGIREVEFIVQSLQLVRGGSDRNLKTPSLRCALQHLGRTKGIKAGDATALLASYEFLRRLENAIQAIRDQQVHDLPQSGADRARVALSLGYADWQTLFEDIQRYRELISSQFRAVAFRGRNGGNTSESPDTLPRLWDSGAGEDEWAGVLKAMDFEDNVDMAKSLVAFAGSAGVAQLGETGGNRLRRFIPALLAALAEKKRAGRVLQRLLGIVEHILRRSAYVALLNENPTVMDRLVSLCEASAWLAEEIGRYPLLLDELLDPRLYTAPLTRQDMRDDLQMRLERLGHADSEQEVEILAQFQRATLFRIAVADVTGNLPIMKVSDRLTDLAEVVLNQALKIAWRDVASKHGRPTLRTAQGTRAAGFGVIAYGKFGGMEMSYRSDLDLVFLHDGHGAEQVTDGQQPLDNNVFFSRLVRRVVHFLTTQTNSGALYQVDTRLRPSGRSGLLVTSVEAFERYQEENAWTWEHQALLRARAVAGNAAVAGEFERVRTDTLTNRVKRDRLQSDVTQMRAKMRGQLDKSDSGHFDLKQGDGGIGDIEFLVQYLVLKNALRHPAVIHYTDNIRQLGTLAAAGCLPEAEVFRLQDIYKTYRLRLHRLALDEQGPFASVDEFTEERAFVVALWERTMK